MPYIANYSFWEIKEFFREIDLVIIGSGIVGLSTAIYYKNTNPEAKVLILESGSLPSGASTKNAGFACFGSVSEILSDLINSNEETVFETIKMRYEGLQKLRSLIGDAEMDYLEYGGFEVFDDEAKFSKCQEEITRLNQFIEPITKNRNTYRVSQSIIEKSGFKNFKYAIENTLEGQIDTGKMMRKLISLVQEKGTHILNGLQVESIHSNLNFVEIFLSQDFSFHSKKVIIATNGFSKKFLPDEDIAPARAQVLITEPIPDLKIKGTFHYDEGFYYFRNIGERVLFGGGRNLDFSVESTSEFGLTPMIQNSLESILKNNILPNQSFKIEQRWSGIMGVGGTKKPIIKFVKPNVLCAVRMGGMGVAIGSLVGETASKMINDC